VKLPPHRCGKSAYALLNAVPPRASSAPFPSSVEPLKPSLVNTPPPGSDWIHEIKYDGYRIMAFLNDGKVKLQTKNGHNWTTKFPGLVDAVKSLPAKSAILDCEMCVLLPSGVSSMTALKATMGKQSHRLVLFAFDLLYLDGQDLRRKSLLDRKQHLARLLKLNKNSRLQYVDHFQGDPEQLLCHCDERGIEGLVSKRVGSRYVSGRSDLWVKTKCNKTERFVIGGFTRPKGSKIGVESVLIGARRGTDLVYVGSLKIGLSNAMLQRWGKRLKELQQEGCSFANLTRRSAPKRSVWLRPQLAARVRYLEVTESGSLRHAALLAIES
jgi:bifunctional non-homologous end joining protein LigD